MAHFLKLYVFFVNQKNYKNKVRNVPVIPKNREGWGRGRVSNVKNEKLNSMIEIN